MNVAQNILPVEGFQHIFEQIAQNILHVHDHIMDPDRIPIAIMAILLTMIAGIITGPRFGNIYPFFWGIIDKTIGGIGERLDKTHRPKADLLFRGFIVTVFSSVLLVLAGRFLSNLITAMPYHGLPAIIVLSLCLSSGTLWYALLRLYFALEKKEVGQGVYYAISKSSRIDLTSTDEHGITRTGMALAARSFDKAMVAPVIWYLIGGFPILFLYVTLSALAWRFGKDGFTKGFGTIMLGLEKLMGFIPSIMSGLILTMASLFTPSAKLHKGMLAWMQNKAPAPYEQGGQPLKALAWALGISLGGAVQDLNGSSLKNQWIGPEGATAKISHKHLRQGIYINVVAHFLFIVILGSAYLWSGLLFNT